MDPSTFDQLVLKLETDDVFHNDSSNGESQISVDQQLLTTLIRMGTYGNGASLSKIAAFFGIGKGTVDLIIRRVITAITNSNLRSLYVRWPASQEKETAKDWVEDQVQVSEWQNGFCMVDRTLIPLCRKPSHHGDTFYDRKSNYSISVQIINLPTRKIIDYASGFRGSRHDSHCFSFTKLAKNPEIYFGPGEWCWGDAGYALTKSIIIPYKSPATNIQENKTFNFHLSRIRIRAEHTIGYLKGRFQSLKELRIQILGPTDLTYATL